MLDAKGGEKEQSMFEGRWILRPGATALWWSLEFLSDLGIEIRFQASREELTNLAERIGITPEDGSSL